MYYSLKTKQLFHWCSCLHFKYRIPTATSCRELYSSYALPPSRYQRGLKSSCVNISPIDRKIIKNKSITKYPTTSVPVRNFLQLTSYTNNHRNESPSTSLLQNYKNFSSSHQCSSEHFHGSSVNNEDFVKTKNIESASQTNRALNTDFETQTQSYAERIVNTCPGKVIPYLQLMRADRPIGSWLLFWPCGWSLAIAAGAGSLPDPWLLSVFAAGAFVMRGAGCTVNDILDRDIDIKVARTVQRPIASGAVTTKSAVVFLGAQLSIGLLLLLQLNIQSVCLGAASLGLVGLYPLVKRVSHWPQLVLGFTFNWGALLGWCAVHEQFYSLPSASLYCAGICWTLIYDTIYAHQDKADDMRLGIKSTALRFGDDTVYWLSGFSALMVTSLVSAGYMAGLSWPYYATVTAAAVHLAYQLKVLDINDRAQCGRQFRSNRHLGLLIFLGIVGGSYCAATEEAKGVTSTQTVDDTEGCR